MFGTSFDLSLPLFHTPVHPTTTSKSLVTAFRVNLTPYTRTRTVCVRTPTPRTPLFPKCVSVIVHDSRTPSFYGRCKLLPSHRLRVAHVPLTALHPCLTVPRRNSSLNYVHVVQWHPQPRLLTLLDWGHDYHSVTTTRTLFWRRPGPIFSRTNLRQNVIGTTLHNRRTGPPSSLPPFYTSLRPMSHKPSPSVVKAGFVDLSLTQWWQLILTLLAFEPNKVQFKLYGLLQVHHFNPSVNLPHTSRLEVYIQTWRFYSKTMVILSLEFLVQVPDARPRKFKFSGPYTPWRSIATVYIAGDSLHLSLMSHTRTSGASSRQMSSPLSSRLSTTPVQSTLLPTRTGDRHRRTSSDLDVVGRGLRHWPSSGNTWFTNHTTT